jgi:cell division protein FtsB
VFYKHWTPTVQSTLTGNPETVMAEPSPSDFFSPIKLIWAVIIALVLLLQVRLWIGEGSFAQVWALEQAIAEQQQGNDTLATRNERLYAEVRNLRNEQGAVEERARIDLGLIRNDETFFLVVDQ